MEIKQFGIQRVLDDVTNGLIRIPAFQRGFVWEPARVATLMDSIFKEYPFGTVLLWRTNARLKHDRKLGPFEIPPAHEAYPAEYVLDGQQRLTAIFCVFKAGLVADGTTEWKDIYFDFSTQVDSRESSFVALSPEEVNAEKHFPLRSIFNSVEYRRLTNALTEQTASVIDDVSRRFQQVQIPSYVYQTEDKSIVSIIFERINRQGLPLNTLQLLSAWTWSEDFQLQNAIDEALEEVEDFGFSSIDTEENLFLRCCSAVLRGDASPDSLLELSGNDVRSGFQRVRQGLKGAIDFVRTEFRVTSVDHLPFQTALVPLVVYFSAHSDQEIRLSAEQRKALVGWFWWTCLGRRYSSGVLRNLKSDIDLMKSIRELREPNRVQFPHSAGISENFFLDNKFQMGTVNSKTLILILASLEPKSFLSGQPVDLKEKHRMSNRGEFHHLFPKAMMKNEKKSWSEDCLANLAFISRSDNRQISSQRPSVYINSIPIEVRAEVFSSAMITAGIFERDDFDAFVQDRAARLAVFANSLIQPRESAP